MWKQEGPTFRERLESIDGRQGSVYRAFTLAPCVTKVSNIGSLEALVRSIRFHAVWLSGLESQFTIGPGQSFSLGSAIGNWTSRGPTTSATLSRATRRNIMR
jgi:hypothetical protein